MLDLTIRSLLFAFCSVLLTGTVTGQSEELSFPVDYVGDWSGQLDIFNASGKTMTVPMALSIQPINDTSYTYVITYGEGEGADRRDYFIYRGHEGPHHWVCDERNSILLDGYAFGNRYDTVFEVMGSRLTSTLQRSGEELIYSITVLEEEPIRVSGGTEEESSEDAIPQVSSYRVKATQRALLRRGS